MSLPVRHRLSHSLKELLPALLAGIVKAKRCKLYHFIPSLKGTAKIINTFVLCKYTENIFLLFSSSLLLTSKKTDKMPDCLFYLYFTYTYSTSPPTCKFQYMLLFTNIFLDYSLLIQLQDYFSYTATFEQLLYHTNYMPKLFITNCILNNLYLYCYDRNFNTYHPDIN